MKALAITIAAILILGSELLAAKLTGQVFIKTRGGESIKLSLVPVLVYRLEDIQEFLTKKRLAAKEVNEFFQPVKSLSGTSDQREEEIKTLYSKDVRNALTSSENASLYGLYLNFLGAADYTSSTFYYLIDLPPEVKSTKTDADGKFTIDLEPGKYAALAITTRAVGDHTEFYTWLVKQDVTSVDSMLLFTNDNLSSQGSSDSLITTPDGEMYIYSVMNGHDLEWLKTIIKTDHITREKEADEAEKQRKEAILAIYRKRPQAAQEDAVALYPDLKTQGTPINTEFLNRVKRYKEEKPDFFKEPDWPVTLAKECAEAIKQKQ